MRLIKLSKHIGLQEKIQDDIKAALKRLFEYRVRIFKSKKDYIDEFSKTRNLDYDYIKDVFQLFFISNLAILVLFIFINLTKLIKRKLPKITITLDRN